MSQEVNDATFRAIKKGIVTSATIIANAPKSEDACERAKSFPNCSFGAHLNVTQFKPIISSEALKPLLGEDGHFMEERVRQISIDSTLANGIFDEFCAQIEKLRTLGIGVNHLDSHHHVHTIPRLFPVLKKVQKQFQIRKVRISRNIYASHENVSRILLFKKYLFNFLLRHYYKTQTTQGFTDFKAYAEYGTTTNMIHKSVEAMVHLGAEGYADESELLEEPWQDTWEHPVSLISYRDLK